MICIDISDSCIYMLEIKGKSNKLVIEQAVSLPLEKNLIQDNNILDKQLLQNLLGELFDQCALNDVAITCSSLPIISNGYKLPYLKNKNEQRQAVLSKSIKTMATDDLLLDYKITKRMKGEDGNFCNVVTYLAPRTVISDVMDIIEELGKKPKRYYITQDSIFNFAMAHTIENSLIICNISKGKIILHLINKPDNVVTRISYIEQSSSLDILSVLEKGTVDITSESISQISKLLQYQAIKSAGDSVDVIYLMGELANQENLAKIKVEFSESVKLLSDVKLPFAVDKDIFNGYIYALSAAVTPS